MRIYMILAFGLAAMAGMSCGGSSSSTYPTTSLPTRAAATAAAPTSAVAPTATTASSDTPAAGGGQIAALTSAAKGTWTGEYGTLTFNADGTATFSIKNCGSSEVLTQGRPFGVLNDCAPDVYVGKLGVRPHEYAITDDTGAATVLQAYVDADGNLHVGSGTLDELDASGKGAINIYAAGTLIVGDTCTYKDPSSAGSTTAKCSFSTKEGQRVLTYELPGTQPGDEPRTRELVHLPDLGLIVEPAIYLGKFTHT